MPMMKCPVCSAGIHIKPLDSVEWKRAHSGPEPHTGLCFLCWGNLSLGQRVKVRALPDPSQTEASLIAVGDLGVITEISRTTPDGIEDEYRVRQVGEPSKWTTVLRRSALQRIQEGSGQDDAKWSSLLSRTR